MALMEAGASAREMSRRELLHSVSAPIALDILQVFLTRTYSYAERPYFETRREVVKMLERSSRGSQRALTDAEAVRRSVISMTKYRKAGEG